MSRHQLPRLAVLRAAPSRAGARARRLGRAHMPHDARRRRRCRVPRAGARARRGRLAAPRGRRQRIRRRGRRDRHARDLPDPRDAGAPLRPGRLRVRDAGPGLGRDQPGRHAEQKARYLPRVARGEAIAAFALSEPEAGSDVAAHGLRARASTATTYVLDGEKTWISNGGIADFYVVFARTRRGAGRARHLGLHRRCRHAGLRDRRAHRRDRAASAGAPALHQLPRAADAAHRRARARASRWRCARSTCSAPRWPPRRWASRAARSTRRCSARRTRKMFDQTLADFQLTQAKLAQMATDHRRRRAADLPRRLAARPGPAT